MEGQREADSFSRRLPMRRDSVVLFNSQSLTEKEMILFSATARLAIGHQPQKLIYIQCWPETNRQLEKVRNELNYA